MRRMFLAMALTAVSAIIASAAAAQNIYVTADRLIDTATGKVIREPAIVIQSGMITAVGQRESVQVPSAAQIIELSGATLLPRGASAAVKPGVPGNLVGVVGDPAKDAALLNSPIFVMKDGEIIRAPAD